MSGGLSRIQSTALGFLVFVSLALAGWGLFRIAGREGNFADSFEVVVRIDNAQDIEPGAAVRIRGIDAGRVTAVELPADDPEHVLIRVRLNRIFQNRLFADANAQIGSKGLLGGNQLNIDPGHGAAGPLSGNVVAGEVGVDLHTVAVKLSKMADQADAILQDVKQGRGTIGKLLKDDDLYGELKALSQQSRELVRNGNSTIGEVREELEGMKEFVRNGNEAISSIKQNSDALKGMPIIRSYVEDPVGLLVRPRSERQREILQADYLFEPSRAILTDEGRTRLQPIAQWLNQNKTSNTEVVVAAFADPKNRDLTSASARKITEKQAEAVAEYLKELGVGRISWLSSRKISPLGMGQSASPMVEKEPLPAARIEVILFTQR